MDPGAGVRNVIQEDSSKEHHEKKLKVYCAEMTQDYSEAVEDIENLEKTIETLTLQLNPNCTKMANEIVAEQTQLQGVRKEFARKHCKKEVLDRIVDHALSVANRYAVVCSTTLTPALKKSHAVVQTFDMYLTQLASVHTEKLARVRDLDVDIDEKQTVLRHHGEMAETQRAHCAQLLGVSQECTENQAEMQRAHSAQLLSVTQKCDEKQAEMQRAHSAQLLSATQECDEQKDDIVQMHEHQKTKAPKHQPEPPRHVTQPESCSKTAARTN